MLVIFRSFFAPPRDLILVMATLWLGLVFAEKRADRYKINISDLNDLVWTFLFAYVLGGRIFFIVEHIPAFTQSPISLISININLFDNFGGWIAGILAGLVYGQRRRLSFWPVLDALTVLFSWLALGLGFSHLASGAAFGQETNLPWAMYLWGAQRQPTQFYEIGASLMIVGLIGARKPNSRPGSDFLYFVALISLSRLVIEAYRGDSTLILGGLRLAQILAWMVLSISLIGLEFLKPRKTDLIPAGVEIRADTVVEKTETARESRRRSPKKKTPDTSSNSTKPNKRTHSIR
jgi:phosphatidylglycerol:prolipoprotein diacylglycerol transferase